MTDLEKVVNNIAINELKMCVMNGDTEMAHHAADEVLLDLLRSLGFGEVCDEWEKVDKWYA